MVVILTVTVAPVPVLFLFLWRQLAKIAVGIAVIFTGPPMVIDYFVIVPDMVVAVVRIIGPIIVMRASQAQHRGSQNSAEAKRTEKTRFAVHLE
jgi:hypothetical protein